MKCISHTLLAIWSLLADPLAGLSNRVHAAQPQVFKFHGIGPVLQKLVKMACLGSFSSSMGNPGWSRWSIGRHCGVAVWLTLGAGGGTGVKGGWLCAVAGLLGVLLW